METLTASPPDVCPGARASITNLGMYAPQQLRRRERVAVSGIVSPGAAAKEFGRLAAAEARKLYKNAVRPIFFTEDGTSVDLVGSSVLVNLDGQRCLVTAAHVVDQGQERSLQIGGQPGFHPLTQSRFTNKVGGSRDNDHVDVAVSVLTPDVASSLSHLGFVTPQHQQDEPNDGEGRTFMLMGYRLSQNKFGHLTEGELPLKIWTCTTGPAPVPKGQSRQFGGQYNFALDYPKRMQRSPDEPVVTTPPRGVSGGAIFEIADLGNVAQVAAGVPPPPKLVGFFIECPGRVLIGTKFKAVRDTLRHDR